MKYLLLIFFILQITSYALSQSFSIPNQCIPIPAEPSICKSILPYSNYFVPLSFGINSTEIVTNVTNFIDQINNPLVPPQCRANLLRLLCLEAFHNCFPYNQILVPVVLTQLQEQVILSITQATEAAVVQNGIEQLWIQQNNTNLYFNMQYVSNQAISYPSWARLHSLTYHTYSNESQSLLLYGNNCTYTPGVLPIPGVICDFKGASLLAFYAAVFSVGSNTTLQDIWATAYNVTAFTDILYFAEYLQFVSQAAIPIVFPNGITQVVLSEYYGQWTNFTLFPNGLDIDKDGVAPDGFEVGRDGTLQPSNIPLQTCENLWDSNNPYSFLNATEGLYVWIDAVNGDSLASNNIQNAFQLTSNQTSDLIIWMNKTMLTVVPKLLNLTSTPAQLNQLHIQAYFPLATCRSFCYEVQSSCASFAASNPQLVLPSCEEPNSLVPTLPNFPDGNLIIPTTNTTNITLPCVHGSTINVQINVTAADIDCSPLIFEPNVYPPCVIPCITPLVDSSKWNSMMFAFQIIGTISWVTTLITLITFLIRKQWNFPRNLPLLMTICSNCVAFAVFFNLLYGFDKVVCKNPYTTATQHDLPCGIEGAWIYFFSISGTFWWMLIAFNLFLTIVLNVSKSKRLHMRIGFYCLGFGIPIIAVIIGLSNQVFGYLSGFPWCFIMEDSEGHAWWELGLWTIPNLIMILIGVIFVGAVIVKVIMSTLASKGYLSSGKKAKIPHETYRMTLFVFLFIYVFSLIHAYRIQLIQDQSSLTIAFENYMTCVLTARVTPGGNPNDCVLTQKLDFNLLAWNVYNAGMQGILVFIFFFLTSDNFKWFKAKFVGKATPEPEHTASSTADKHDEEMELKSGEEENY